MNPLERAIDRARWRLVPFLLLMYVLSYLDRANIGYARQAYQASTGISDAGFAFGAGIFFLTYALFEVPSNLILHRVGARRWLARIMVTWGLLSAATALAKTEFSFWMVRLCLGAAEAGFFPGSLLFLTYWFPASGRGRVMALFYFGSPMAMMFGGPLSGVLLEQDGLFGLHGWQWMFVVEGALASLVGVWAYFYLTDGPAQAAWMPEPERAALASAVAGEEQLKRARGLTSLSSVFRNLHSLHFVCIYFLIQIAGYGVAFYLPSQVSALLNTKIGVRVGIVTAIPWACAILATCFWPQFAARTGYRRTCAALSLLLATTGLCLSAHLPPGPAIAALCLVTVGIITVQPIFWTFPMAYFGGVGAAAGIATINALGNVGGLVAPSVKTWLEKTTGSPAAGLYFLAGAAAVAAVLLLVLPASARESDADAAPISV